MPSPVSVTPRPERLNIAKPNSRSRSFTAAVRLGCETYSSSAALFMLPVSAMVIM